MPTAGGTHARGEGGTPPSLHLTILISQMLFSWLMRPGYAPCYGDCKRCWYVSPGQWTRRLRGAPRSSGAAAWLW